MIIEIFIALLSAIIISWLIITLADKKNLFLNDKDLIGVQKFHTHPTPQVGGLAVLISFAIGIWFLPDTKEVLLPLLLASLPTFLAGLIDDISSKIKPFIRLMFTFVSIAITFFWLHIGIFSIGFSWADNILSHHIIVSFLFSLLVIGGAVNALNIIDGYNGLMSGYAILVLLAIALVSYSLGDNFIMRLSLLLSASIFGFFLLNFPFGKIFMGDGGAYFIGFVLANIGLMFASRHDEVSNWFVLLLFVYPLYELLFSIYRKKFIKGTLPSQPDGYHLHMLVYKRRVKSWHSNKVICNSTTSPFLWALSLIGIIPAVIWHDKQTILIICAFIFMAIYTIIYCRIVRFRFKK